CAGSNRRETMSDTCGIDRWSVRGNRRHPNTVPPRSGPTALYASHATTSSSSEATNITTRRTRRIPPVVMWSGLGQHCVGDGGEHALTVGAQCFVLGVVL